MVSIEEANKLMKDFVELREVYSKTKSNEDLKKLRKQEELCVKNFDYLIKMRTGKYRLFSNYEDLNQEGREALLNAMKTYKAEMGNWFSWAHKYISTRISRSANLHTTIRYPLKFAKEMAPHKEVFMPEVIEEVYCPDTQIENMEVSNAITEAIAVLDNQQQQILSMAYGLDGDKPMSINKICNSLKITRATCLREMKNSLSLIKDKIKI